MKAVKYAISLLALGALLAACGAAPAATAPATTVPAATELPPVLGLDIAPWQDGSTASYEWLDASGNQIGTSQFEFSLNVGVWTIAETDAVSGLDQTVVMRVDAATLAPLGEQKTIHTANSNVDLTTQYENGKLIINANVNGQNRTASLDVPANAIDNDQLLMTLRALPFAQGYEAEYVIIVADNALKVNTTVTVQAKETVDVPAGSFESWRVQIAAGQSTQTAWYQVNAPHMLVQYDNGTNRMVLTGGQDPSLP
jgi:hypothetical protein